MGCGCNKRNQRRAQVVRTIGPRTTQNNNNLRLNDTNRLVAQGNQVRKENLNQGGISAEKRKIQAIRRNEILKKLGKR